MKVVAKWKQRFCYYDSVVNVVSGEAEKKYFHQSLQRSERSRVQHLARG